MLFKMAFEVSLGLFWGAFVGCLPFVALKARMTKKAAKNAIDAPVPGNLDLASLMSTAAQIIGKAQ